MTLIERLRDLHKQATVERSHYYVGKCALDAADRIETLEAALREVTPYVEAFRREEKRADDLARDLDDLRAALAARIEKLEAALREIADRYANTLPAEVAIDALGLE